MKLKHGTVVIVALLFICCGMAMGVDANRLCIHSGGDYFITGHTPYAPNSGGGKYFPSFTHIPTTKAGGDQYPWKIKGWAWTGMQAGNYGQTWNWCSVLLKSKDTPYSSMATFPYPALYTQGMTHSGPPPIVYNLFIPSSVTQLPGIPATFSVVSALFPAPSSMGGFDQYMNIFAGCEMTMVIPSTTPYYSMEFAYIISSAPLLVESSHSIWEYVWDCTGPNEQYLVYSHPNLDCTGTLGGNKGRNYSLSSSGYWPNTCTGGDTEWAMCLFVEDALCIPVNVCPNSGGPFAPYGFDVGSGTVTPFATSGLFSLQAMYESYANPGDSYWMLACLAQSPAIPYGKKGYRVPGWEFITDIFASLPLWMGTVAPGYPGGMYGTTVGGHSMAIPAGPQSNIYGLELVFYGFSTSGGAPTAGFMATFF